MRPTVLLDCDGPLADFTDAYLELVRDATGNRSISIKDVDRWSITACPFFEAEQQRGAIARGWTDGQLKRICESRVVKPGFCENIGIQPGAKEAVGRLQEIADVWIVTSPWDSSPTWCYERARWVKKHFGIKRVIQTPEKHLIRGDMLVDDKPIHVSEWAEAWPMGTAVLFDMRHNQAAAIGLGVRAGWPFILAEAEHRANR